MPDQEHIHTPLNTEAHLRFLTFRVDKRRYALRADDVAEVMRVPAVTKVPQSPRALVGLANLRGSVLPVVSLSALLGMEEQALRPTARVIVLAVGASVAIIVDAVDTLVTIAPDRIESVQSELGAEPGERLSGSFQAQDGHAVKILDVKALLSATFVQRSRNEHKIRHAGGRGNAEQVATDTVKAQMLVTFEVAGQEFALGLEAVMEILPAISTRAALPRAEALVLGVTSLRGALLPLLSLRALLGFPPAPSASVREKVVVMKVGGAQVGLVADRARAIVSAAPDLVDPIPPVLSLRMGGEAKVKAIYRAEQGRRLISILAPEQLFREDVMQRLNAHGDTQSKATTEAGHGQRNELSFLVFRLGDDEFALPIEVVDEVAQVPKQITRVPKTPKFLEGVINMRGVVLPVIDQRGRFDMPKSDQLANRRLVVVRTDRHRAGLIVDSISDVLKVSSAAIEPAPDLTERIARLVRGVINLEQSGRILLVLDPSELLTSAEQGLLDVFQTDNTQAIA